MAAALPGMDSSENKPAEDSKFKLIKHNGLIFMPFLNQHFENNVILSLETLSITLLRHPLAIAAIWHYLLILQKTCIAFYLLFPSFVTIDALAWHIFSKNRSKPVTKIIGYYSPCCFIPTMFRCLSFKRFLLFLLFSKAVC